MKSLFKNQIDEVAEIDAMFFHLKDSARAQGMSLTPFKFFGFPETTIHYHIFRAMRLEEEEMQNKWRYRDQDADGLYRCLAILHLYKLLVSEEVQVSKEIVPVETLKVLATVSKSYQKKAA